MISDDKKTVVLQISAANSAKTPPEMLETSYKVKEGELQVLWFDEESLTPRKGYIAVPVQHNVCFESRDGTTVTVVGAQQVTSLRTGAVTNYRLADVGLLVRRPSGREKVISLFKLTKIALTKTSCGPMQRSDPKRQRAFVLADGTEVLEFGERWCPDMVRLTSTSRFMMIMRPTANVWLEEVEAELC